MLLTKQLKDIIKTKKDRFFIKNKKAQRNAVLNFVGGLSKTSVELIYS